MPLHVRVLVIVPLPQLTEHSDQSDQADHDGQGFKRQILVSFESPSHIWLSSEHSLSLELNPGPHVAEHSLQSVHDFHTGQAPDSQSLTSRLLPSHSPGLFISFIQ